MEKYSSMLLKYCKIDFKIPLKEICTILVEKSKNLQLKESLPQLDFHSEMSFISEYSNLKIDSEAPPNFARKPKDKNFSNVLVQTNKFSPRKSIKLKTAVLSIMNCNHWRKISNSSINIGISKIAYLMNNFWFLDKSSSDRLSISQLQVFDNLSDEIKLISDWNFNILEYKKQLEKFRFIWTMFHYYNYFEKLEIIPAIFKNFLIILNEKYNHRNNPFHNFDHGITGWIYMLIFLLFFYFE